MESSFDHKLKEIEGNNVRDKNKSKVIMKISLESHRNHTEDLDPKCSNNHINNINPNNIEKFNTINQRIRKIKKSPLQLSKFSKKNH